ALILLAVAAGGVVVSCFAASGGRPLSLGYTLGQTHQRSQASLRAVGGKLSQQAPEMQQVAGSQLPCQASGDLSQENWSLARRGLGSCLVACMLLLSGVFGQAVPAQAEDLSANAPGYEGKMRKAAKQRAEQESAEKAKERDEEERVKAVKAAKAKLTPEEKAYNERQESQRPTGMKLRG
ncbi:unnamed protein product, partial [Polarella glacialis]